MARKLLPSVMLLGLLGGVIAVKGAPPGLLFAATADKAPTEEDKKMLADVASKLLAVCDKPEGFEWPPEFSYDSESGINAYSTFMRKDGKRYPIIRVTDDMLAKVIKGNEDAYKKDRLAFILGHELGHIVKGHLTANPTRDKTPFLKNTFGRGEEDEADRYGAELALKAGFSIKSGLLDAKSGVIPRMQALKLEYSSFEGLGVNHPSWNDRAAKLDKEKAFMWKAMAAFNNGVLYLTMEDFNTAALAFEKVVGDFPNAYEAWANLGYSLLMDYCDGWKADDIKDQGIGQIVTGGFYSRLGLSRAMKDSAKWWKAVGSLREANRIKPGQTIVLANLGIAYLFHPEGKAAGIGDAAKFFAEAVEAAKTDKDLDPVAHAAILINLGISTLAGGDSDKGLAQLDEGEKFVKSFAGGASRQFASSFNAALNYSRASLLGARKEPADKEKAVNLWGQYLRTTSPKSHWWAVAYDRYADLCKELGREAKAKDAFKKDQPEAVRPVSGVMFKPGTISLLDEMDDVVKKFGKGKRSLAIQGYPIQRVRYEEVGVELIVNDDQVIAVILIGEAAPAIPVTGQMVGAGKVGELKIGMSWKDVTELLGEDYQPTELTAAEVYYRFFRQLGVAVRVSKGKVTELVVVQAPQSNR